MSDDEYTFLDTHNSLHWCCKACNVATTIKLFSTLKQKVDNLEAKLNDTCDGKLPDKLAQSIDLWMNEVAGQLDMKVNQVLLDFQGIRNQISVPDTKLETAIEAKLLDSVRSIKKDLEPSWLPL